MKALVTGGAGFVGSHLCEYLLDKGWEVTSIDNLSTGSLDNISHLLKKPGFKSVIDTILNREVMDELVSDCDVVFHLAAAVGVRLIIERPVETIETNILGTETVINLVNRHSKKVIIASTSEVYGKNNKAPFTEEDDSVYGPTTKSRWSYACSKAIDEFLSLAYYNEKKTRVVIARLFNTVGPRQTGRYGMVLPTFVQQALLDLPITVFGDGKQQRCFTYVGDVVWAFHKLAQIPEAEGQVYNVGSDQEIAIMELAELVREMTQSNSEIVLVPYDKAYKRGFEDMLRRVPNISKLKKLTGYGPTKSIREIVAEIIEYYRR